MHGNRMLSVAAVLFAAACGDCGGNEIPCTHERAADLPAPPAELPTFAAVHPYSAESPYNQPVPATPEIDPVSDAAIAAFAGKGEFTLQTRQFTAPVYVADASTPRASVSLACGAEWELGVSRMVDVPIPPWAEPTCDVDGADNPAAGCGEEAEQDNHMIVLDLEKRCEYDFWQMRRLKSGGWEASWGKCHLAGLERHLPRWAVDARLRHRVFGRGDLARRAARRAHRARSGHGAAGGSGARRRAGAARHRVGRRR